LVVITREGPGAIRVGKPLQIAVARRPQPRRCSTRTGSPAI